MCEEREREIGGERGREGREAGRNEERKEQEKSEVGDFDRKTKDPFCPDGHPTDTRVGPPLCRVLGVVPISMGVAS